MKRETIEQFLDEALIHKGPYSVEKIDFDFVRIVTKSEHTSGVCIIGECYSPEQGAIFAASRDMLIGAITTCHILERGDLGVTDTVWMPDVIPETLWEHWVDIIEKALPAYEWPEIKAQLEEIEGANK